MINIIPENDKKDHIRDIYCWCAPKITDNIIIIHNSADCREIVEKLIGKEVDEMKKWAIYE